MYVSRNFHGYHSLQLHNTLQHQQILAMLQKKASTPLMLASYHGHLDDVKLLLEAGAYVPARELVCYLAGRWKTASDKHNANQELLIGFFLFLMSASITGVGGLKS